MNNKFFIDKTGSSIENINISIPIIHPIPIRKAGKVKRPGSPLHEIHEGNKINCIHWIKGYCKHGAHCPYRHSISKFNTYNPYYKYYIYVRKLNKYYYNL